MILDSNKTSLIRAEELNKLLHLGNSNTQAWVGKMLLQFLKLDKINEFYAQHQEVDAHEFVLHSLNALKIRYELHEKDIARIQKTGAFVAVCNHPLGGIDGLILLDILLKYRPNSKVMGNFLLTKLKPLSDHILSVNPFERFQGAASSHTGIKASLKHLAEGHPIAIFPAGEVSTYQNAAKTVVDKNWSNSISKLIKHASVPVIPIYFEGQNSWMFHVLGLIHPLLRTAKLPSELFNKRNSLIKVRIGTPIPAKEIQSFQKTNDLTKYLRARTYALGSKLEVKRKWFDFRQSKPAAIADAIETGIIKQEMDEAKNQHLLFDNQHFSVLCVPASKIPNTIKEIGRLREITFRAVGEGTNKSADIDPFDLYYEHLIVWDNHAHQIVGAYRLCKGKQALYMHGKKGFYLSTLFKMDDEMLPTLQQSIELGRSFIVEAYQRKPLSLFLLWKGIFYYLLKNPEYRYLIGPVSISNDFSTLSKAMIVEFIKTYFYDQEKASWVKARKAFRVKISPKIDSRLLIEQMEQNLNKLDSFVKDIEFGFGAPVLLKKYLKLNAKMIGFNMDPHFNNSLDGLVLVDIMEVDPDFIRSLSKELQDPSILDRFTSRQFQHAVLQQA